MKTKRNKKQLAILKNKGSPLLKPEKSLKK